MSASSNMPEYYYTVIDCFLSRFNGGVQIILAKETLTCVLTRVQDNYPWRSPFATIILDRKDVASRDVSRIIELVETEIAIANVMEAS